MNYNLFIDDQIDEINCDTGKAIRDPAVIDPSRVYVSVKTVEEAMDLVLDRGCPDFISFDHDLGLVNGKIQESYDFVKWLVDRDMDSEQKLIPKHFDFQVHSKNPIGKENLERYLRNYLKQRTND